MIKAPPRRVSLLALRHFAVLVYALYFWILMVILWQARHTGQLTMPSPGMDQLTMLQAAADLYRGNPLPEHYLYPQIYTLFLTLLVAISCGDLIVMRILHAVVCAFIPVLIYKLSRRLRFGRNAAMLAAILYCFYAAAALISLDFLRAGPLALCFIGTLFLLTRAFTTKKARTYFFAGAVAGLCVLGRTNFMAVVILPLLCYAFPLVRRHLTLRHAGLYFSGIAICVLPILTYNLVRNDSFSVIPNLYAVNIEATYGNEIAREGGSILFHQMLSNMPGQWLKFASSYEIPNSLSVYVHQELVMGLRLLFIPFNLLLAAALSALLIFWRKPGVLFVIGMVLGYAASISVFDMLYRYRIPVVPLVCCLAGCGIMSLTSKSIPRHSKLVAALFILIFFCATYHNPNRYRPAFERGFVADRMIDLGRFGEAEAYLNKMSKDGIDIQQLQAKLARAEISSVMAP